MSSLNTKKRSSRKIGKKSAAALTVPSNGDAGGTTEGASDVKKVEAALRESEERFRLAMNNVAAGVYTLDLQGMVTYVNPAAEVMLGWTNAELLGKKMHDATHYKHPDGSPYPASECPGLQVLEKGIELREYKDVFIRKDGSFLPVVFSASPLIKNGRTVGVVVGFRDDTVRREAESVRGESEERFRLIADVAPVMIWMSDVDKRCTYFNQGWLDFTGRSLDAEIGDGWVEGVHPDDLAGCLETYTNAFDRREAFQMEYHLRRHDGEYRLIFDSGVPRFNLDGVFAGYIGSCIDISERKRVDEALRESEERFRRVFEEGPLGLALVGRDFRFAKVNAALCQMVGYSEESLVQMSFADITHPDDLRADVELAERLFRGEIPFYTLRKRYVKKNGEIIWINLTASLVHNKDGEPIYGLAMVEDITEVKRAREVESQLVSDLADSRDEIRALAASLMRAQEDERRRVSRELHDDICQQLASLARDIGMLAAGPLPSKNLRAQLEAIRARAVKTSQDTRHIAYQMHTAVLDDLGFVASLKDLCSQFSERYPNISWSFEHSGLPALIPPEVATCFYRVAQESLQNKAKHSQAKFVSIRLGLKKEAVVLTIRDDGVGFDVKAVKGRGGLGLISMKERARLVNGKLTLTSRLGHGTQLDLEVPLPVEQLMKRARVLLADDHAVVLEDLRAILAPNYEIVEAVADGRALVEAAQRLRPDLIVADITMPLLNGIDAAVQIRKSLPGMKLVFVTMHASTAYLKAAFEAGGTGYVLKSGLRDQLPDAVQSVLGGRTYVSHELSTEFAERLQDPTRARRASSQRTRG